MAYHDVLAGFVRHERHEVARCFVVDCVVHCAVAGRWPGLETKTTAWSVQPCHNHCCHEGLRRASVLPV